MGFRNSGLDVVYGKFIITIIIIIIIIIIIWNSIAYLQEWY